MEGLLRAPYMPFRPPSSWSLPSKMPQNVTRLEHTGRTHLSRRLVLTPRHAPSLIDPSPGVRKSRRTLSHRRRASEGVEDGAVWTSIEWRKSASAEKHLGITAQGLLTVTRDAMQADPGAPIDPGSILGGLSRLHERQKSPPSGARATAWSVLNRSSETRRPLGDVVDVRRSRGRARESGVDGWRESPSSLASSWSHYNNFGAESTQTEHYEM